MRAFWSQNRVDIAWSLDPWWIDLDQSDTLNVSLSYSQPVHVRVMTCTSLLDCRALGPGLFVGVVRFLGPLRAQSSNDVTAGFDRLQGFILP